MEAQVTSCDSLPVGIASSSHQPTPRSSNFPFADSNQPLDEYNQIDFLCMSYAKKLHRATKIQWVKN